MHTILTLHGDSDMAAGISTIVEAAGWSNVFWFDIRVTAFATFASAIVAPPSRWANVTAPALAAESEPFWATRCWA